MERLQAVLKSLNNDKSKLVIDLSCRRRGTTWFVAMNKWQTMTDMEINQGRPIVPPQPIHEAKFGSESINMLQDYCAEFLVHAADNEGLQQGIDEELVRKLAEWCTIPVTYAGGGRSLEDLDRVNEISGGRVDLTIGSALDIFGGSSVRFEDCIAWNRRQTGTEAAPAAVA